MGREIKIPEELIKLTDEERETLKFQLFGQRMSQAKGILDVFSHFLGQEQFDLIVELGTGRGTLSSFLGLYRILTSTNMHTFDVNVYPNERALKDLGIVVHTEDIFSTSTVKDLIQNNLSPKILLICDNGDKIRELNTFSPYLKSGDFVMAHDYFPTMENWMKRKCPWSNQINLSDVKIKKNNLVLIYQELFEPVFWGCFRKNNDKEHINNMPIL